MQSETPSGTIPSDLRSKQTIAIILVILATIIWGSQYLLIKESVESIPPLMYQGIRHVIAFLAFAPFWGRLKRLDKTTIEGGSISAIVFFFLLAFLTYGLQYTTSNKGAFLTCLYVVFVPFIANFLIKSPIKKHQIGAVVVATVGMAIMIFGNANSTDLELAPNIGDILVILGAFFNAIQIVLIEKYVKKVDIFAFIMLQMILISVFMFVASWIAGERFIVENFSAVIIWGLIYLGVCSTTLTLMIQTWAQKFIDSTRAAIMYSLEPVFAVIFGIFFGQEYLTLAFAIGALLIFIGILWSSTKST
jgi:drug/metabolite transporter (DMT)-like permease